MSGGLGRGGFERDDPEKAPALRASAAYSRDL